MKIRILTMIVFCFGGISPITNVFGQNIRPDYNIIWKSSSANASESMPVGGGDIGCNVWVENGDLLFYVQRSGCFSENGEYLKLGRFRISMTPNPFLDAIDFTQELVLDDGYIRVNSRSNDADVRLKIWVDKFTNSVHIDALSECKLHYNVSYESWRFADCELKDDKRGRFGCFGLEGFPGKVLRSRDSIFFEKNKIVFFHRNPDKTLSPDVMIQQQGLERFRDKITNNISQRTFGGCIFGDNLIVADITEGFYNKIPYKSWSLRSKKGVTSQRIILSTHIAQTRTIDEWFSELNVNTHNVRKSKGNLAQNKTWWNKFWQRSWIYIDPMKADKDSMLWQMGRNYQLFRYQLGCNLDGEYPTKFNGGNFTFDPGYVAEDNPHDPDWRAWGGDVFTAQNQRLVYWPLLKSGDAEGMKSQFNLYEMGLSGAMLKAREHFGHGGAVFCEYANAAGLDMASGWGWDRGKMRLRGQEIPFGDLRAKATATYGGLVEAGVMANGSIAYHWESQIEHAYMILEYNRFTGANIDRYMPFIKQSLIFFDEHYQKRQLIRTGKALDAYGKLVIFPSTTCESYRGATNPIDVLSGMNACLQALLLLKSDSLSKDDITYFKSLQQRIPNYSFDTIQGDRIIKPAQNHIRYQNVECPQFYPLFPFNRFTFKDREIESFKNTWRHGTFPKGMIISWHQDGIFFARMRMIDDALNYNKQKLKNAQRRFPTFWGPGHDWVPDHNWGGSGMIGLQEMLLQTMNDKIYVLPAWPKEKDVHFKLHAPFNTTVEVKYINGKIYLLKVLPGYREKDVEIMIN